MKAYITVPDYLPSAIKLLENSGIEVRVRKDSEKINKDKLISLVEDYEIILTGIANIFDEEVFRSISKLKILGTLSVGTDHISEGFFNSDKVNVLSLSGYNAITVSEFIYGQIINLYKGIYLSHFTEGARPNNKRYDLFGKTIGVIGAGNIGTEVIKKAKCFGINIICNTLNPSKHSDLKDVEFVSLDKLLKSADITVVCVPSNKETINLLNKDNLKILKSDSILVSISRREVVDLEYLYELVKSNEILGAAVDVSTDEVSSKYYNSPYNLMITPHLAGVTIDANSRADSMMAQMVIENLNLT